MIKKKWIVVVFFFGIMFLGSSAQAAYNCRDGGTSCYERIPIAYDFVGGETSCPPDTINCDGSGGCETSTIGFADANDACGYWDGDSANFICGTDSVNYGGQSYSTVQLGSQCWLRENLNVGSMIFDDYDETSLPVDPPPVENEPDSVSKYCYDDVPSNCNVYGGMYTWAEANALPASYNFTTYSIPEENQGICPAGWHIPSHADFLALEEHLGMCSGTGVGCSEEEGVWYRGTDQGTQLQIVSPATFSALLTGFRSAWGGFYAQDQYAYFWITDTDPGYGDYGQFRQVGLEEAGVFANADAKTNGLSVRCMRNISTTALPSVTVQAATDITSTTAVGNGFVIDDGGASTVGVIKWGTTPGVYTSSCIADGSVTGNYSCDMTDLLPNTTYYVAAEVTNVMGSTDDGEVSFTTSSGASLSDIIIPDPDPIQMNSRVSEGYISISAGSMAATPSSITNVNVTYRTSNVDAIFPTGTTTTEIENQTFSFENFTIRNITEDTKRVYPDSRAAFRLGITGTNLSFSQPITIHAFVGNTYNDQELDILYQNEGDSAWYTHETPTCIVSGGICTFTTDHATIYTINGIHQSEGDTPLNLNVEVQSTLSMDCYDTSGGTGDHDVSLGTTTNPGTLTAGTPAIGQSTCTVTTNDTEGYYLTLQDNNPTHTTLTHTDSNTATIYEIQDLTPFNEGTKATENWTSPTTKGLGFSIISFPDTNLTNNTFNGIWTNTNQCPEGTAPDTNDYAGIPNTPQTIAAVTQYEPNTTTTNICYKVDVPPSQPSGIYQGSVTYTATSDASSYLN